MARWRTVLTGCAALLALPFSVLGPLVAPLLKARVERRARRGAWGPRRDFCSSPEDQWRFSWAARSEEEARRALSDALAAILWALPAILDLPTVHRLEILNPTTGFAVSESKLRPVTSDLVAETTRMLYGEHAESATLLVNGLHRLGLELDARSFVAGFIAISLGAQSPADLSRQLQQAYEGGRTPGE